MEEGDGNGKRIEWNFRRTGARVRRAYSLRLLPGASVLTRHTRGVYFRNTVHTNVTPHGTVRTGGGNGRRETNVP